MPFWSIAIDAHTLHVITTFALIFPTNQPFPYTHMFLTFFVSLFFVIVSWLHFMFERYWRGLISKNWNPKKLLRQDIDLAIKTSEMLIEYVVYYWKNYIFMVHTDRVMNVM